MLRAIPPEDRGKVITQKIQTGDWQHSLEMMKDPEFLKAHNLTTADVSVLQGLPPEQGNKLFGDMIKAGQQNNLQAMKFVHEQALEAQRESAAAGRQASSERAAATRQAESIAAADARQAKSLQAAKDKQAPPKPPSAASLRMKAGTLATQFKSIYGAPPSSLGGLRAGAVNDYHDRMVKYMTAAEIPKDQAEQMADSVAPKTSSPVSAAPSPTVSNYLKKWGLGG
jgi:hypothetical protein